MSEYLILKLQGPMQAWGGHTYENYRPTELFPTRSALVGLVGACLGIRRAQRADLKALSESFRMAVRVDRRERADGEVLHVAKVTDFHTVENARKVDGKPEPFPVVSRREYLCDAQFTVALEFGDGGAYDLETIRRGLQVPRFTPYLGRRSCPLGRPLLETVLTAEDLHDALAKVPPRCGTVYGELEAQGLNRLRVRDVPVFAEHRQFRTRSVYIHPEENDHVPQ